MPVKNKGYAYKTDVDVATSRAQIEGALVKAGANQMAGGWDVDTRSGWVVFALGGRHYRLEVPQRDYGGRDKEQVDRERWRTLLLVVKARIELVRSEMTSFEQEFMPHLLLPNGQVVGAVLLPQIAKMYESGKMLPLLPGFAKQLTEGTT